MFLIQLSNVNIYLPEGKHPFLKDLSIEIRAGEWISLVGKNGCGKSLLGKLIAGLDIKYEGERILGKNSLFQLILQNPDSQLVGETVWEDVCFGLESHGITVEEIRAGASKALKRVGLSGLENRPVHSLSGGQKQLLAIAGAIALKPSAIIADEVTSMLDPTSRLTILQTLQELKEEGITIIMITQLLEELGYSDRLIAIDEGHIVYEGSTEGFFYNGLNGESSVCEEIGLELPYTVRVAKGLLSRGIKLNGYPLEPKELIEAVALR